MKQFLTLSVIFICLLSSAQSVLVPANNIIDLSKYQNRKQEMAYYIINGSKQAEIGSFTIETMFGANTFTVITVLRFNHSNDRWIDTSIADGKSFQPIYRSSFSPVKEMVIQYGTEITGYYLDKKTGQQSRIKESVKEGFFDSYMYPYLLSLLPLQSGYKTDIAVYDYKPGGTNHIAKSKVKEVTTNLYNSALTGEHKVWLAKVFEETTNENYTYHIDKETKRIWKVEISTMGQNLILIDRETDHNPFKTVFNKEETLRMIQSGNSTISGQAFARDNENEGSLKGMAVLNINKKQFAQPGTSVLLIPYTAYFKEWISLNEKLRKKGRSVPLAKEAAACIKTTTVYDQDGHFEFTNLMPGEYLLYTEFGYTHTTTRTEVVGYTDTYINGMFQGSSANTETYKYGTNAVAGIKKIIQIKTAGETVSVKLKKTL